MRPIKELLLEEYWNIAFRETEENDFVFVNKNKDFRTLKESKRYWYADPFLFEYKGETWLFLEAFDNKTEKGLIAYSKYENGNFSSPQIALEEEFHLSYPFVYEENGEVFMMPETSADSCIQVYKAVAFPGKWEKHKVIVRVENAVDTIKYGENLITSVVTDSSEKRVDVDVYNMNGELVMKSLHKHSQQARGAGRVVSVDGNVIRPAQDCTGGVYGAGLVFYQIEEKDGKFSETQTYKLSPKDFRIGDQKAEGVHTYARTKNIEVLDFKRRRLNLRRILWIVQKKL